MAVAASWSRGRTCHGRLPQPASRTRGMVAAAIRTIFAQPDAEHVGEQFEVIAAMLGKQLPKVETMLRDA